MEVVLVFVKRKIDVPYTTSFHGRWNRQLPSTRHFIICYRGQPSLMHVLYFQPGMYGRAAQNM